MRGPITAVIGSDPRQGYLAGALRCAGLGVRQEEQGLESALDGAQLLVLPLPVPADGVIPTLAGPAPLTWLLDMLPGDALVMGGRIPDRPARLLKERGFEFLDYYRSEGLQLLNALPTAEGALAIAIQNTPDTILGMNVLVTGWGRIARRLCPMLLGLGARVYVAARRPEALAEAGASGCGVSLLPELPPAAELGCVFNTVPSELLGGDYLRQLPGDCPVVELASAPGGVDRAAAELLGVRVIDAPGLPGKVAPRSAARYISGEIIAHLREREML